MKTLQAGFWFIPAAAGLFSILSENQVIATDYILSDDVGLRYAADLFSIITALGGTYLALRLPHFPRIKQALRASDSTAALRVYRRLAWWRLAVVAIGVWGNALLYYAASYSPTPKYSLLIALFSLFFCYPSRSGFTTLRTTSTDRPAV